MAVYLVTWDLNREKPNYSHARNAFLSGFIGLDYAHDSGLDSVRFVSTPSSSTQLYNHLVKQLDLNDRLVVTRVRAGEATTLMDGDIQSWIDARL